MADYTDTWPPRAKGMLLKPSRTARKVTTLKTRTERKTTEDKNKRAAKKADGYRCRFPWCGCKQLGLRIESSHQQHKGMGGNPKGDRSTPEGLLTLCVHRHQDGKISIGKGTLWAEALDKRKGVRGPVRWWGDRETLGMRGKGFYHLATESKPGLLDPSCLTGERMALLEHLATMVL